MISSDSGPPLTVVSRPLSAVKTAALKRQPLVMTMPQMMRTRAKPSTMTISRGLRAKMTMTRSKIDARSQMKAAVMIHALQGRAGKRKVTRMQMLINCMWRHEICSPHQIHLFSPRGPEHNLRCKILAVTQLFSAFSLYFQNEDATFISIPDIF